MSLLNTFWLGFFFFFSLCVYAIVRVRVNELQCKVVQRSSVGKGADNSAAAHQSKPASNLCEGLNALSGSTRQ